MLILFSDIRGIVHHEFAPEGQTVNAGFYSSVLRCLTFGENELNCGARAIGCSMMKMHPLIELSQRVSFSPKTALSHFRIRLTRFGPLRLLPLPEDEAAAKGSSI